jgi:hypothetical protein
MNLEYDDGRQTCEHCGRRNFPEVGMSVCECFWELGARERSISSPDTVNAQYAQPEREVIPPAAIDFLYVAHQTQKATLFALKDGRQQWVPKSLILSIDDTKNRIIIAGWFARKIL